MSRKNRLADVNVAINEAEISNQAVEEAVAGQKNGCLTGDEHIQTQLNREGHTPSDATVNDVTENEQTQRDNVSEDDPFDEEDRMRGT